VVRLAPLPTSRVVMLSAIMATVSLTAWVYEFCFAPSEGKEKQAQVIADDNEVSSDEDLPL
jgi:hypothetical protein